MWQRVMSGTGWGSRLVEPEMTGLGRRIVRCQLQESGLALLPGGQGDQLGLLGGQHQQLQAGDVVQQVHRTHHLAW